jgi:tight adherence protein B
MSWELAIASLVALTVAASVVLMGRLLDTRRRMRERLRFRTPQSGADSGIFRSKLEQVDARWKRISMLIEQAGYDNTRANTFVLLTLSCTLVAGLAAWRHTGNIFPGLLAGVAGAFIPYVYLVHKRQQRLRRFEQQFPDALDMMTRSIRAGHALSGAIALVGEEMPDPVGQEFRRVFEEIRMGLDPGEALAGIQHRVPTEDTTFFYTAISIQRIGGGNLAEILDRLAEVIRERFKLLKQARVLSTQHRWTAICVGLSPFAFALMFAIIYPGYFDPLLQSPLAPYLFTAGFILETIGFFTVWKIAQIEV